MVERVVNLDEEMRTAYLDYAMSVIVSRALPDVRDGLKPVQRRVLYAMYELGMRNNQPYRKSARVVGDVIAKFHPHGDSPVYDALVRLAQPFSLRYPLVDGQGNFGSIDNDPPAAMRYTEARLSAIAEEMLTDIERDTVTFVANFDGAEREPVILPARLPQLLVNGASGIAVGMATSIPPHNLTEVCNAIIHRIDNPEATVEDLLQFIHGPDFPTGAIIRGRENLLSAYSTGHGKVVVEARADIQLAQRGSRPQIVITEIPYQVNKAALVQKIADLARERRVDGIAEVRDESDRQGLRVVVELRRDAQPEQVLNNLYQHTAMRSAFFLNMLALVDGQPRVLRLHEVIQHFIDFRREVVANRAHYDLRRARDRAHVLEGLKIALDHLDEVIAFIRGSESADAARTGLIERYGLSQRQAQAILDMQLRRLAALERQAILNELAELLERIQELEDLLANPSLITAVVRQEVEELRDKYGDTRRTEISDEEAQDFRKEDLIPHQEVIVTLSRRGYIKRLPATTYRTQRRGGRGITGMTTREEDAVQHLLVCDTHDTLLLFTSAGRVSTLRCFDIPGESSRTARGIHVTQLTKLDARDSITAMIASSDLSSGDHLVFATRKGVVKRTPLYHFASIRSTGINAMGLRGDDELVSVRIAHADSEVLLATAFGQATRFSVAPLREASRSSGGVLGIRLRPGDRVIAMEVLNPNAYLLSVTANGMGKITRMGLYPLHGRGGQGVRSFRLTDKTGPVVAAAATTPAQQVILVSKKGIVNRVDLKEVSIQRRATQGVAVMRLEQDDEVASLACLEGRHLTGDQPEEQRASEP